MIIILKIIMNTNYPLPTHIYFSNLRNKEDTIIVTDDMKIDDVIKNFKNIAKGYKNLKTTRITFVKDNLKLYVLNFSGFEFIDTRLNIRSGIYYPPEYALLISERYSDSLLVPVRWMMIFFNKDPLIDITKYKICISTINSINTYIRDDLPKESTKNMIEWLYALKNL